MTEYERHFFETFANLLVTVALRANPRTTPPPSVQAQPEEPTRAEDPPREPAPSRKN